jgi:outer membrane scaffolding protein for murein synthesis (MipA/OmpV family)
VSHEPFDVQIFAKTLTIPRLSLALVGQLLTPVFAQADDGMAGPAGGLQMESMGMDQVGTRDPTRPTNGWDIALGAGVSARPTYEGSDRYLAAPSPLLNVTWTWADRVSIGPMGVSAYWHHEAFRVGAALAFDGGRRDTQGNGIFRQGDDRLRGLGNIGSALGPKLFASYSAGAMTFSVSVTKLTGGTNNGILADAGLSVPYKLTERASLVLHAGTTWQDAKHAQAYFGVTAQQALDSIFPQFTARAGFKDVTVGVALQYQFDRHWFLMGSVDAERLLGDAARSPITFASTSASGRVMFGYHF